MAVMSSDSDNEKQVAAVTTHQEDERNDTPIVVDVEMERRAVRKLDWHIIPMVMWYVSLPFQPRCMHLTTLDEVPQTFEHISVTALGIR
jgi:hypothetical protein